MNDLPSFSVVTPTLNQARYIKTTIESVLDQHYSNLEYLVIDGGSTDGTHDILQSYGQRLTWYIEKDAKQSKAINIGWLRAGGDILSWINSDDIYYPGTFNQVGEYFRRQPEVDMLYGRGDYINAKGEFLRPYPIRQFDFKLFLQSTENYILQPAVFIRRQVLDKVGFLDETLDYIMDFDFWLRIGLSCNVKHVPERLAALRLHPDAKSVARLNMFGSELIRVYQKFFSDENLSNDIIKLKRDSMANIYNRAADCAFWGQDYGSARSYAKMSLSYRRWPPRRLWFWIALGHFGGFIAEKKLKNPYIS